MPGAQQPLATPGDLAEFLGVPEKTLTNWRTVGKGPRYIPVGRYVRYRWNDIEAWLTSQQREPGTQAAT
jgi:predicted DNA-binding transcriptional regulator AlpA